jgi:hypothetical protein
MIIDMKKSLKGAMQAKATKVPLKHSQGARQKIAMPSMAKNKGGLGCSFCVVGIKKQAISKDIKMQHNEG